MLKLKTDPKVKLNGSCSFDVTTYSKISFEEIQALSKRLADGGAYADIEIMIRARPDDQAPRSNFTYELNHHSNAGYVVRVIAELNGSNPQFIVYQNQRVSVSE